MTDTPADPPGGPAGTINPHVRHHLDTAEIRVLPNTAAQAQAAQGQRRRVRVRGGVTPAADDEGRTPAVKPLPADCPVQVHGHCNGVYYFTDAAGQWRELPEDKLGQQQLTSLFGGDDFQLRHYPRTKAIGDGNAVVVGWRPEQVRAALIRAAHEAGVIDVTDTLRGRGAHRGEGGELIWHLGDRVLVSPRPGAAGKFTEHAPGKIGSHVYPRGGALPGPVATPIPASHSPARALRTGILGSWNWERGELDARLLVGWIGAAMVGGALDWRPTIWIAGAKGTGKTTASAVIKALIGERAMISTADASAAGIHQKLGQQTLPVLRDEAEAEEDPRAMQNNIRLARNASSGTAIVRGGANHQSSSFRVRSCFGFLSINTPPLLPQDRSRVTPLNLRELPSGQPLPRIDLSVLATWGAQMRRRLLDGWPRLPALIETFRAGLFAVGHTARAADQLGTLLAIGDLIEHDLEPSDRDGNPVQSLCEQLKPSTLTEIADDVGDEFAMLQHLLSSTIDPWRNGTGGTVAEWIRKAVVATQPALIDDSSAAPAPHDAARTIERYGLKIHRHAGQRYLFIITMHAGLSEIFAGTHWAGRSGAVGGWTQAARRLPGAMPTPKPIYMASMGQTVRGTLVPLGLALGEPGASENA